MNRPGSDNRMVWASSEDLKAVLDLIERVLATLPPVPAGN